MLITYFIVFKFLLIEIRRTTTCSLFNMTNNIYTSFRILVTRIRFNITDVDPLLLHVHLHVDVRVLRRLCAECAWFKQ